MIMIISSRLKSLSGFVLFAFNCNTRAVGDTALIEEALSQWRVLEKAGSQLECSYTLTVKYQKEETITRMKVLRGGGDHLWIYTKELRKGNSKNPPLEKVVGKNRSYAFRLSRKGGSSEYTINYIGPKDGNLEKYLSGMIAGHSGIPWSFSKKLSSLVQDSDFKLQGITREQREGKNIIKMIARYTPLMDDERQVMSNINITLNPERHFCILSFSFRMPWGRVVGVVDYGPEDKGLPVPIRYTMTQYYDKGGETVYETVFENWKYRCGGISEEDFYLGAFGLPEPMGTQRQPPSRTWLWLLGATVAAAAIAVLFAWLKRRRATIIP